MAEPNEHPVSMLHDLTSQQAGAFPLSVEVETGEEYDDDIVQEDDDHGEDDFSKKQKLPKAKNARKQQKPRKTENDRIDKAEERIAADKFDTEAWTILMNEVQTMPIEEARPYYERLLEVFPTAGRYWKSYAEQEMQTSNFDKVEKIFGRCLLQCLNVELWKCYLSYIRTVKDTVLNRDDIKNAYEFALDHVGMDIASTKIWIEYIEFFKRQKNHFDINYIKQLRLIYQKAIQNPMHNLDIIWKEYESFENEVNKPQAKNVIGECSAKFKAAWNKYKEKKSIREGLLPNMLARPPRGSQKEEQQKNIWKQLIDYEIRNTQRLTPQEVRARVSFTYNQALLCLYHYPDVWYDFALYLLQNGSADEAAEIFERSTKALPTNLLLHFAYADFEESRKNYDKTRNIYETLLKNKGDSLIYIHYQKFLRRIDDVKVARNVFIKASKDEKCTYHVYVGSAMDEFNDTRSENRVKVARKVFELGLQKYMNEPAFLIEYLNFLDKLGDKNNMRVLFEKVLNTGSIPKEKAIEIWNRYLQFEYEAGDPPTIDKVEKRREEEYPDLKTGAQVKKVVNRYRFMDLWPCTPQELEIIFPSKPEQSMSQALAAAAAQAADKGAAGSSGGTGIPGANIASKKIKQEAAKFKKKFIRPDFSQMVVFNPLMLHPGGVVPADTRANADETYTPPEDSILRLIPMIQDIRYNGPYPDIDYVLDTLRNCTLPPAPHRKQGAGGPVKGQKKRGREAGDGSGSDNDDRDDEGEGGEDDEDDEKSNDAASSLSSSDIYGRRRQKRMRRSGPN